MNKVILTGRLTQTPELKTTNTGASVLQFSLAVRRSFKNTDGEYDDKEYEFLKKIAAKFEISEEELGAMMGLVSDYVALFNEIIITVIDDENEI